MLGHHFYNQLIKKYIVVFGTMFNDIAITKRNQDDTIVKNVRVPISYGPKEKFLVRKEADPNLDRPYAITLPRMAFEMNNFEYDGTRKLQTTQRFTVPSTQDGNQFTSVWQPVPFNINFQLNVMTRSQDDAAQIVEQIIPFFTPDWTNSVVLFDSPYIAMDIPLVLSGVSHIDTYESDFQTRRTIIWTFDFVMKAWFFGPTQNKKIIKVANSELYSSFTANTAAASIQIRPGLTIDGEPTTDPDESVDPADIEATDNWDYIVTVTEPDA